MGKRQRQTLFKDETGEGEGDSSSTALLLKKSAEDPFAVKRDTKSKKARTEPATDANDDAQNQTADNSEKKAKKKEKWSEREKKSVFINQIPYNAKESDLRNFLTNSSELSADNIKRIRMLENAKGSFKGVAIVELDSIESKDLALKLHKSEMKGRNVNVQACLSKEAAAQEREKKVQQGFLTMENLTKLFAKVNHSTAVPKGAQKQDSKQLLKLSDFDQGVQSLMLKSKYVVVEKALKDYVKASTEGQVRNSNSFVMKLLHKYSGTGESSQNKMKTKKVDKGLSMDAVKEIIANSSKPRRSKKRESGGRLPAENEGPRWTGFNEKCLATMAALPSAELKRKLAEFYKANLDGKSDGDKNKLFLKICSSQPNNNKNKNNNNNNSKSKK